MAGFKKFDPNSSGSSGGNITTDATLSGDGSALTPLSVESDSYTFVSIAERDAFFNVAGKSELLKSGLMVGVNTGSSTLAQYEWSGSDSPVSYDNTMWTIASIQSGTGSFLLGDAFRISAAGDSIANTNIATGESKQSIQQTYESGEGVGKVKVRSGNPADSDNPYKLTLNAIDNGALTNPTWSVPVLPIGSEEGQTALTADVVVDASSTLTNVVLGITIDGTLFEAVDVTLTTGNFEFVYNPPFDFIVGQLLSFTLTSMDGDVVLRGDTGSGLPVIDQYVYTWDEKSLATEEYVNNNSGLGYILNTWGANLQTPGRHPAINGAANAAEIPSLGISASAEVPAAGTIDTLTYYNATGDNTTTFQIIKNGVVMYTFTCVGPYGVETGINVPIGFTGSVADNIAIRYSSGTAPGEGFYSIYIK